MSTTATIENRFSLNGPSPGKPTALKVRLCRMVFLFAFLVFGLSCSGTALANTSYSDQVITNNCQPFAGDELWLISARDVEDCQNVFSVDQLKCYRMTADGPCQTDFSELAASHQSDLGKETFLHVHGTRTNFNSASRQCTTFYRSVFCRSVPRPPIRFICWIWRSESETVRPLREYRQKSQRSVRISRALTETLRAFGERPPVLSGHSLGAQLIAAAVTDPSAADLPCYRFAVLAPVLDCQFANLCQLGERIPGRVQETSIFVSRNDRAVNFATRLCQRNGSLSFQQWAALPSKPLGNVSTIDVTADVGRRHLLQNYSRSSSVINCLNQMIIDNAIQYSQR